jgi:menaquinone-dependent protoporphyrinogen oxidase
MGPSSTRVRMRHGRPMDDATRVLVGYATAAGSTTGIAERIAATLREAGGDVTCRPVGPDLDPAAFDVLVVGSAVHNMSWLRPALDFVGRIPAEGNRPTWCFSVGGVAPHGPLTRRLTSSETHRVERGFPSSFRPREHRFFGGVVEMRGLPLWGKAFWRLMGGRPGDHRDWPAIESWARQIATTQVARRGTAADQ